MGETQGSSYSAMKTPALYQELFVNKSSAPPAELKAAFGPRGSSSVALQCNHGSCSGKKTPDGKCAAANGSTTAGHLTMVSLCLSHYRKIDGHHEPVGCSGCQLPPGKLCVIFGLLLSAPTNDGVGSDPNVQLQQF